MPKWSKQSALKEIDNLIHEADQIVTGGPFSAAHTRWDLRVRRFLKDVFGEKSIYLRSFCMLTWQKTGSFVVSGLDIERETQIHHFKAFVQQIDIAKGLLQGAWDELNDSSLEDVYNGKDTPAESSAILKVLNLAEHRLRKVIRKSPEKETEVQEAFENLLIGADIPYSREAETIEYSAKTYRPDFTMKQIDLAIEIKLCARNGREKEIIAEVNDDILAYQTKYGNILFIVYDVGQIRDNDRFTASFEKHDNVTVRVVKH